MDSYFHSRQEISSYLREARGIWPELDEASARYDQLAATIPDMASCIAEEGGRRQVSRSQCRALISMLKTAQSLEDQAVERFRAISRAYPDPKRSIVPRWGTHTPK